jgi:RNA polymerase sigma factor (TIGR02999 family)
MPDSGQPRPFDNLAGRVYDELRRMASGMLAGERPGQTLQPTALVHEAYLRLASGAGEKLADPRYFFAAAAEAMRRILVDRARRRSAAKRGGGRRRVELNLADPATSPPDGLLALDEALASLAAEDARKAELVKLRFFAGLTSREAAEVLGVSLATAERWWAYARAWLFAALRDDNRPAV